MTDHELDQLRHLVKLGTSALDGDSNDAEHDALHTIVAELEALLFAASPVR